MLVTNAVGREAATKKYDMLSALAAYALSQDKHKQRQVLRLMSLITARYNWQRDELSMGQTEIARLWSVDPRTVKREMAKLRNLGWLVQKTHGARGRVSVHGISFERIMDDTRASWACVGPDLVARLEPKPVPAETNILPFKSADVSRFDETDWGRIGSAFNAEDAAGYRSWIAALTSAQVEAGVMTLIAPSRFHATYVTSNMHDRLLRCVRAVDPSVQQIVICH